MAPFCPHGKVNKPESLQEHLRNDQEFFVRLTVDALGVLHARSIAHLMEAVF